MYKALKIVLLIVLMTISLSFAQVQKVRINTITVEGNKAANTGMIRLNSGLSAGIEITGEDLQKAVKNLWALSIFSDIQIYVTNQTVEGLDILIRVKEYPRLNEVVISGNDELSEKDIKEEMDTYRSMIVTPNRIYKFKSKILDKYHDEGYLLAEVNIDTVSAGQRRVNLAVNIDEGKEVQVEKIRFHGNVNIEEDDLRDAMDEIKEDRWWRSADFNPEKYEEDKKLIIQYCKENGYRDAEIIRDSISYNEDQTDLYIDIWITEGPKYYFGDISFSNNVIFEDEALLAALDIGKGDVYDQKKYDEGIRDRLQKMYYNQGYLFASIQPIETPVGNDTLNIDFNITEGHVVHIKELQISGNSKTNEKVIRREFDLHPGDVFNSAKLERSIRNVTVLNYFAYANPDVRLLSNDDKNVNLVLDVEEKSTDMANMSAGYSQYSGMIGSLGLTFNNFSLRHPLAGGDGQRLVFDWQFGRIYRSFSISFTEPWLFDTPTLGGFSIFDSRRGGSYYPWDMTSRGITLRIGRRLYWPDNYFRGDWILRYAETKFTDIADPERYAYILDRPSEQRSITQIFTRDSRNSAEFPTRGSMNSLSTELSGGILGGEQDYFKTIFISEWYTTLPFGFVLYSHNKYGILEEISSNSYILYNEYFYMGGSGLSFAEGLRGYNDGRVGPLTDNGDPKGGKTMAKNTLELRFQIVPNPTIFGLLFAEGGNVWETLGETNPFDLRRSVGVGFRLFMPMIGIIGVDFGYGFDGPEDSVYKQRSGGDWKVHFQFGRF
ncbi:MAG: outer membrane protein assembly factor BamA [Calditrichaceae bacterium]